MSDISIFDRLYEHVSLQDWVGFVCSHRHHQHLQLNLTHTCTHAHMHTCTHAHMHTCTHAHTHTRTHAHTHTCTHAHMHTCTHAHMHHTCTHAPHMHSCTHTVQCMHSCTHGHMHTCTHEGMKLALQKTRNEMSVRDLFLLPSGLPSHVFENR
jgi:hypothetical protein